MDLACPPAAVGVIDLTTDQTVLEVEMAHPFELHPPPAGLLTERNVPARLRTDWSDIEDGMVNQREVGSGEAVGPVPLDLGAAQGTEDRMVDHGIRGIGSQHFVEPKSRDTGQEPVGARRIGVDAFDAEAGAPPRILEEGNVAIATPSAGWGKRGFRFEEDGGRVHEGAPWPLATGPR